jgi:hypothetical protein
MRFGHGFRTSRKLSCTPNAKFSYVVVASPDQRPSFSRAARGVGSRRRPKRGASGPGAPPSRRPSYLSGGMRSKVSFMTLFLLSARTGASASRISATANYRIATDLHVSEVWRDGRTHEIAFRTVPLASARSRPIIVLHGVGRFI